MKRYWTIRIRLTVLYGGLFFLAGTVLLGVTYLLVRHGMDQRLGTRDTLDLTRIPVLSGDFQLPDGTVISREQALDLIRQEQQKLRDDTMNSLLAWGGVALAGVGAVAVAAGWLLAGRALRPIGQITETARRIGGADGGGRGLHERIALAGPRDELKQLADTFDLMLERLDRSFEGQRRFVASASHELRTPLAINRALIEVSVTRPSASPDARELGAALLDVNARHERLVDGLLTLADSENEVTERHPVDLADLAGHAISGLTEPAVKATLNAAPTAGDPYLLERLVQNLVENAVQHNLPKDGWLAVRTWTAHGQACLEVLNSGPEVRRFEAETLFQPFRRLNGSRTRGFGLGLSIVRAVARRHGGDVRAVPRDGGGLVVTVSLASGGV